LQQSLARRGAAIENFRRAMAPEKHNPLASRRLHVYRLVTPGAL
jgi:hypothetical protein